MFNKLSKDTLDYSDKCIRWDISACSHITFPSEFISECGAREAGVCWYMCDIFREIEEAKRETEREILSLPHGSMGL